MGKAKKIEIIAKGTVGVKATVMQFLYSERLGIKLVISPFGKFFER